MREATLEENKWCAQEEKIFSLLNKRYFLIVNQKYFIVGPASFFNVESIGKGKDLQNTDGFSKLHIQIQMMAWVIVMIVVSVRNKYDDDIW